MTSWFERQASSHHVQLAATAFISGVAVAGLIYGTQAVRRKEAVQELKASIPELNETHHADMLTDFGAALRPQNATREDERVSALARRAQQGDYDKDLINEQLTRTASFLGTDRFALLRNSFVIVVGLGGVGSHCTSALARSGVSKIRLIDFDQVTLSSLNRHAVATLADVGTPKVECVKKRLQAVVPWVQWDCINEVWRHEQAERLLGTWCTGKGQNPDYVVDAIDNIDSKVALLRYCHRHDIKVVSSMGAGCKGDPTRVSVGDISASVEDPLSRVTRRRLRALGISEAIPVVYSAEKPGPGKAQLLPLREEDFLRGHTNELSVLPDFRARILPVLGTMPAVFGYTVANFVILELTGYPHESGACKGREKMYDNILANLQGLEERLVRHEGADSLGLKIPVTKDDVGYLIEEVYRGKSVVSNLPTRLALVRWTVPEGGFKIEKIGEGQKSVRLSLNDLVCMTKDEAAAHEKGILKGNRTPEEVYSTDVLQLVERRRGEERYYHQYSCRGEAVKVPWQLGSSPDRVLGNLSFNLSPSSEGLGSCPQAAHYYTSTRMIWFLSIGATSQDGVDKMDALHDPDLPPPYDDCGSGDDYPSEDELSDRDLDILNTDYRLQTDLTFHPTFQSHSQPYTSFIPPRLQKNSNSADDIHALSEKYPRNIHDWNRGSPVPPRTTSLHRTDMYNGGLRNTGYGIPQHDAHAYQSYQKRRPLIDLIRNEWKTSPYKKSSSSSSPGSPNYSSPNWIQVCSAPRVRRYMLLLLMLLSLTLGNWHYWAGPTWTEHRLLSQSLSERMKTGVGWFGENTRPEFLDMVQVKTLHQALVPAREDRKRLIVIGDVHGCSDELENLLAEVQYEARTDHLVFAGDFISKGPSSSAVIDFAMSAHASCVRGNHEDRVLLTYRDLYSHRLTQEQQKGRKTPSPPAAGMPEDMRQNDGEDEDETLQEEPHGDAVDRRLAESFTKRQIDYMASCPVILDIGQIKGLGDVHVVHAGLVPGVRLERQDPLGVMHMRTIDLDTHVPSSSAKGMPWFKLWNKYQSLIPSHRRSTVIYGHDSRRGLQIQKYSKGLDTGCVRGGQLSALIIDNDVVAKEPVVISVQCKDYPEPEERKDAKK